VNGPPITLKENKSFTRLFGGQDDAQYVDRLLENAGVRVEEPRRAALIAALDRRQETRAGVLLQIVELPVFVEKEKYRSPLLLHYFGYLRRNPDDPPDGDLRGFNFWLRELERHRDLSKLSVAFKLTGEYHQFERKP
jgi:hypothetical protein